ncbi:MAG TPA: 3-phosphoshikimate 1-carboxyvinyltransferase [Geminicoccaceae bacterium]|nr:3-phosphoshikimate 1-carboxyvinyltransferase [Geminicoccaceae bacterium]
MRLMSHPAAGLSGRATVPGDKSLSHRALLFGALAAGESRITGLLEGADVLATAEALRALGVEVERTGEGRWRVHGRGLCGLAEPDRPLDLGNSGTAARLLLGVLAGHPFTTFLTGDESLRARPMRRVIEPLCRMGAKVLARCGERLPLALTGSDELMPIRYELPVASAQVKSAVLLAGLHAAGRTTVIEPQPSRDHTERLLGQLGAELEVETLDDGRRAISVVGQPELDAAELSVPGDISSAAFPLVAAAVQEGSALRLDHVGVNPLRSGLLDCLVEMGAELRQLEPTGDGEPVAALEIVGGSLAGIEVRAERAPRMIDEYPILAVAAACAQGPTRLAGLAELRVKESDRLAAIARGLAACGVEVEVGADSLIVHGRGGPPPGGAVIDAHHDHRIAMSFLVLGALARTPVTVAGAETIETSFPGFAALMNRLGANIETLEP